MLNWIFQRGGELTSIQLSILRGGGGVWIFSGTTQFQFLLSKGNNINKSKVAFVPQAAND